MTDERTVSLDLTEPELLAWIAPNGIHGQYFDSPGIVQTPQGSDFFARVLTLQPNKSPDPEPGFRHATLLETVCFVKSFVDQGALPPCKGGLAALGTRHHQGMPYNGYYGIPAVTWWDGAPTLSGFDHSNVDYGQRSFPNGMPYLTVKTEA